jgi:diguanylate cyclase (GGDEF)-like protein
MSPKSDNAAESNNQAAMALTRATDAGWSGLSRLALLALGVALVAAAAKLLMFALEEDSILILRLVLSAAAIALAFVMTLRHRKQWVLPAHDMERLVHEFRVGRAPIEELRNFPSGNLQNLAAEVKLLMQDLRQQRRAVEDLQEEVRQRLANRTTVLERAMNALRSQAVKDSLTGLYNRRMLDQFLPQVITQCATEHKPLTLLMFDVDHFKALNDTLGHAAGDELLRSVGQIIHSTIRENDIAFRYGGDEFTVVLPECDAPASKRVTDRLQSLVKSLGETLNSPLRPRLSIGISTLEELTEPTAVNLLKRADERLYESKAARRQVAAAPSPAPAA